jgi:dsRNA-specific ribonuclease
MVRPSQKLESTMKTREMTNEALNDEALESVAGGIWEDGGCTPLPDLLNKLLKQILHPSNPGGPINAK